MKAAIVIFSGFTERSSTAGNGCARLYDTAADEFARRGVRVIYHPWTADTRDLAWHLWDRRHPTQRLRIAIAGYSYGANAAIRLTNHLTRCGLAEIDLLGLIDPVVRWDFLPGLAAALGLGQFAVPCEVRQLVVAAQSNPRWSIRRAMQGGPLFDPAGHPVATCPPTRRYDLRLPQHTSHRRIDEAGQFANCFLARVEAMLAAPEPRAE